MKSAFLFPGQGSQSVGMMRSLADASGAVEETFAEASRALGFDLWDLVLNGPEDELNRTERTQPAMLAADIATWRVWRGLGGPEPDFFAGHSLGEYAALVAAGSIDFEVALPLVATRGRLMQEATPPGVGAMAAILGLDEEVLEEICTAEAAGQVVSCANYNAPGQIVIAGHREAVERASEAARAAGARRALVLPVSVPSHCALMQDAAVRLGQELEGIEIRPPSRPVIHNVDARTHEAEAEIRDALGRQLWQPVRWTRSIERLRSLGVARFVECGPGKVLAGLNRRIARDVETVALTDLEAMRSILGEGNDDG